MLLGDLGVRAGGRPRALLQAASSRPGHPLWPLLRDYSTSSCHLHCCSLLSTSPFSHFFPDESLLPGWPIEDTVPFYQLFTPILAALACCVFNSAWHIGSLHVYACCYSQLNTV